MKLTIFAATGGTGRHILVKSMLRQRLADLAEMEEVLRASDLDWTVVRPPRLTDKPITGDYRTARGRNVRGGSAAARANVAHLMLSVIDQPRTIRQGGRHRRLSIPPRRKPSCLWTPGRYQGSRSIPGQ